MELGKHSFFDACYNFSGSIKYFDILISAVFQLGNDKISDKVSTRARELGMKFNRNKRQILGHF